MASWAIAEWSYTGQHEDELSFEEGDHILILDASHEEWWEGECKGRSGVFPANRCKLITGHDTTTSLDRVIDSSQTTPSAIATSPTSGTMSPTKNVEVLHDEEKDDLQDYTFTRADNPELLQNPFSPDPDPVTEFTNSPPPQPEESTSEDEEVVLPPNWSATTNDAGRLYYYNIATKETSWKRPRVQRSISQTLAAAEKSNYQQQPHPFETSDDYERGGWGDIDSSGPASPDQLPEGWSVAHDDEGSQYYFNEDTGESTWDIPGSPDPLGGQPVYFSSKEPELDLAAAHRSHTMEPHSVTEKPSLPKRQSSVDDSQLHHQISGLRLSDHSLEKLQLDQLPIEHIQRRGTLHVKSQKIATAATISSWKDYWIVVYKGFLIFYRDDGGAIRHAYSQKLGNESLAKIKHATHVKPSGCFDVEKINVEIPTKEQALTKKKNCFCIVPQKSSVRLLLQDTHSSSGSSIQMWVDDIASSLAVRQAQEAEGQEDILVEILKHQTSGHHESTELKMNRKIDEKDHKQQVRQQYQQSHHQQQHQQQQQSNTKPDSPNQSQSKNRGLRSMVIGPRRKSDQDERLKLPDDISTLSTRDSPKSPVSPSRSGTRDNFFPSPKPSSKDKDRHKSDIGDADNGSSSLLGSPQTSDMSSHKKKAARLSNMSRNFFSSKDKDKDKETISNKSLLNIKKKDMPTRSNNGSAVLGTSVFGGSLTIEPGHKVPRVVELCIKTIEARGLSTAGIYRVSGHMASINNLKRTFNEFPKADVATMIADEPDINTIAALLKLYFRELKEPLLMFDFYHSFIVTSDIEEYNERLYTIKALVHALPKPHFDTLEYLLEHLGHVQDAYEKTKMDSANLAICFAPNLLRPEVNDLSSIINTGKQSALVDTLIEQRAWIFEPYPEEDEEVAATAAAVSAVEADADVQYRRSTEIKSSSQEGEFEEAVLTEVDQDGYKIRIPLLLDEEHAKSPAIAVKSPRPQPRPPMAQSPDGTTPADRDHLVTGHDRSIS